MNRKTNTVEDILNLIDEEFPNNSLSLQETASGKLFGGFYGLDQLEFTENGLVIFATDSKGKMKDIHIPFGAPAEEFIKNIKPLN